MLWEEIKQKENIKQKNIKKLLIVEKNIVNTEEQRKKNKINYNDVS